jgi:hypothetical protein
MASILKLYLGWFLSEELDLERNDGIYTSPINIVFKMLDGPGRL